MLIFYSLLTNSGAKMTVVTAETTNFFEIAVEPGNPEIRRGRKRINKEALRKHILLPISSSYWVVGCITLQGGIPVLTPVRKNLNQTF